MFSITLGTCYCATVSLRTLKTSKEFIKCRLENFSIGFILFYLDVSKCKKKEIGIKYSGTVSKSLKELIK